MGEALRLWGRALGRHRRRDGAIWDAVELIGSLANRDLGLLAEAPGLWGEALALGLSWERLLGYGGELWGGIDGERVQFGVPWALLGEALRLWGRALGRHRRRDGAMWDAVELIGSLENRDLELLAEAPGLWGEALGLWGEGSGEA